MNFKLTEEQELIRNMVREFAEKELAPLAPVIDAENRFPVETIPKMKDLGILSIPFPKEYGGGGGSTLAYAIAVEEVSRACASTGIILSVHVSLCSQPIYQFGNEEQKKKYLTQLASGQKLGAFGLTEPGAGTDAASQQTEAVLDGDEYVLNGSKIFTTNGGQAEIYVVFAMTDKSKGVKGISAFIVELGTPGFEIGKYIDKMGIRGSGQTELFFKNCRIPKENLLGKEGDGFKIAMMTLDGGRIGVAAQALGIAQASLDAAIKYSKERIQFGKPISSFQAVQWMLADMATQVEAARHLVYHSAWLKDNKMPFSTEAAMAKMFASEAAVFCANRSIQVHGGHGFTKDYPVERYYRDAKITEIYEGTNEAQRMVISGNILR